VTVRVRAATRASALARWQATHVSALLRAAHPDLLVEPVLIETIADQRLDVSIESFGGKGVFVKEIQAAVLDGRADIAVHSAKDLPSITHPGLVLACVPERGDPRDVLVGSTLAGLGPGAHVATGSQRRRVQLAAHRPDLVFSSLRGNIATRLGKASSYDAIVMAKAALDRLKIDPDVVDVLDPAFMVPQVGQGALAVECRVEDTATRALLAGLEHAPSRRCVDAERAFLAELGGDCTLPAGAFAVLHDDGTIEINAILAADDGQVHRTGARGLDGPRLAIDLAIELRARISGG
jgi:hydroxymethylbilane synthase